MTKRKCNPALHTDTAEARELHLYAINDANLYRQKITPILENLKKKIKKGIYDKILALKLWRYAADNAAKHYNKEFMGTSAGFYGIFTVSVRNEVSTLLQEYYDEELHYQQNPKGRFPLKNPVEKWHKILSLRQPGGVYQYGNRDVFIHPPYSERVAAQTKWLLIVGKNTIGAFPTLSKAKAQLLRQAAFMYGKNPAPRIGTARPRRASQVTGKLPTKRLVARRVSNTKKGYFPNPPTHDIFHAIVVTLNKKKTIIAISKNAIYANNIAQLLTEEKATAGAKFTVIKIRLSDYVV